MRRLRLTSRLVLTRVLCSLALSVVGFGWQALDAQASQTQRVSAGDSLVVADARTSPLSLLALLDSVATGHPLVAATRARVRSAEAVRASAGVFTNPVLGFEIDNTPFPWSSSVTLPLGMDRERMTTATIPLEPFYQRSSRIHQANAELRATRAEASGERQRIASEAVHAFYRTALAQVSVDASRDLATWLDTLVSYNANRVDQGAAAEADLIRSQLERDRALADQAIEEAELARARAELASFVGDVNATCASDVHELSVDAGLSPLPLVIVERSNANVRPQDYQVARADSASSGGAGRRPDVLAARERVNASGAAIANERAMLFRQLGATIGVKQSAGTSTMIAGVSLPLPLFDQNRGQVARAQAEREIATYTLADRVRTANAEIEGAKAAARVLTERTLLLAGVRNGSASGSPSSFLSRADDARRIALGAYREGAVPLIQVLDAARAWGESRRAFYRTLYEQHESVLDLLTAEGADLREALSDSLLHTSPSPSQ